jgi:polyisoprenyl-phosphate glycosyltransferase
MIPGLAGIESEDRQPRGHRQPALLTVVTPMYNEVETARAFLERLRDALGDLSWELIAVDDGSTDGTTELLRELSAGDERVRVIRLSRNFGHQAALTAGLDHATGDAVVMIDADLQDPPEVIPRLLDEWRRGADVVHAVRATRQGEPRWRLALIRAFYRLFGRIARIEATGNSGDFRLLGRRALAVLTDLRERNRFLRGMSVWIGFEQAVVRYDRDPRYAGATKYPLRRLVELGFDAIISFSYVPLRLAAVVGTLVSIAALISIPVVIALRVAGEYVPGIASVTIVLLLLGGVQLLTLGIIGEYLGRSYDEVKQRPIYIVGETINLGAGREGSALERIATPP